LIGSSFISASSDLLGWYRATKRTYSPDGNVPLNVRAKRAIEFSALLDSFWPGPLHGELDGGWITRDKDRAESPAGVAFVNSIQYIQTRITS
jgi:hypothetical protein